MNSFVPPAHLSTPFDAPSLALSLQSHDMRELLQFTRQLRTAGYRVALTRLANDLLDDGFAWIEDSCGQPVQVRMPARQLATRPPLVSPAFTALRLAA